MGLLATHSDPIDVTQAALIDLELVEPGWFVLNTEFFLHALRHPEVGEQLTRMIIAAHDGCLRQSRVPGHELEPGQLQLAMLTLLVDACPKIDPA